MKYLFTICILLAQTALGSIKIINPSKLKQEVMTDLDGHLKAGMANFGHIDYGSSFLGQVFVPLTNLDGCETFDESMFNEEAAKALFHDMVAVELPVILVERGSCTFVTKVRNVEKAGANVAIIGDTKSEKSEVYIMTDDGSGHSINIPSFFVPKNTSEAFQESYKNGDHIIIQVKLETGHSQDGAAVLDLWYSTPFDLDDKMLESLRENIPQFGDKIQMHLKVKTEDCVGCAAWRIEECISDGKYCPIEPNYDEDNEDVTDTYESLLGKDIIKQSLLIKCVHMVLTEYSQDQTASIEKSLDYMLYFKRNCTSEGDVFDPELFNSFECAFDQMKALEISPGQVQQCFDNSFEIEDDIESENLLLAKDKQTSDKLGIYLHPGFTINDMTYRGYMEGEDLFDAICSSFTRQPYVCSQVVDDFIAALDIFTQGMDTAIEKVNKENALVIEKKYQVQDPQKVRRTTMWVILFIVFMAWILFLCIYNKCRKKQLNDRMKNTIDSSIVEYIRCNTTAQQESEIDQRAKSHRGPIDISEDSQATEPQQIIVNVSQ